MITKICPFCKKEFYAPHRKRKFCSYSCHAKSRIGNKNPKWHGGWLINDGYKYIYSPNHPNATLTGYVLEHRLIMEKILGRYLNAKEVVHHINHNKLDNRPENLMLFPSTGKHAAAFHRNIEFAKYCTGLFGKENPNYRNGKYCK